SADSHAPAPGWLRWPGCTGKTRPSHSTAPAAPAVLLHLSGSFPYRLSGQFLPFLKWPLPRQVLTTQVKICPQCPHRSVWTTISSAQPSPVLTCSRGQVDSSDSSSNSPCSTSFRI